MLIDLSGKTQIKDVDVSLICLCVFRVYNRISEVVAEQLLPYSVLESLDLSSNSISELKTGSFPPMQLKYLYILFVPDLF